MMLKVTFWALVTVFLLIVSLMVAAASAPGFRANLAPFLMFVSWMTFFLLGLTLVVLTLKQKVKGRLKKFLLLTGASAAGFFVSVILHNFIYGWLIFCFGQDFWDRIGLGDEPIFFLLAIVVCPIGFLIGVVGSLVLLETKKVKT